MSIIRIAKVSHQHSISASLGRVKSVPAFQRPSSVSPAPRNQGRRSAHRGVRHAGLAYGSHSEVAIARELTRRGIVFAPLPTVVAGDVHVEVDFLVVHRRRVMVVEIHGKPFHRSDQMASEWNRGMPLMRAGAV